MEDPEVVIRLKDVSKTYRIVKSNPSEEGSKKLINKKVYQTFTVFHDLNLEVHKGEVIGILGTNGCGKSTFLKIVSKILKPDTGKVYVKGKVASILELSMGFHPDLSGYDNIFLRSELYGIPHSVVEEHIDEIVRYADLGDYVHNPVRMYSSGMRARLAFSIMIHIDADIFLVDEALSTGDARFASKASEHLKNLVREGKTILMTSHSMGTIENTCDRAIWLCDHTIRMDGPAETVCAEYNRSLFDSFEDILSLAEDGSSSAQYRLACCYRDGDKTAPDQEKYRYWLSEAALKNHTLAMAEYADLLMEDDPVANADKARELYCDAADRGNYEARRKYSALISPVYSDLGEFIKLYEEFADGACPAEKFKVGNLYYKTAMNRHAYELAAEWFVKAYDEGNIDAGYMLGTMMRDGIGVPREFDKGIELLSSVAELGYPRAQTDLAHMYDDGKLVARDVEKAFYWYLRSAEGGNARSQYEVAVRYRDGIGVDKDMEKAVEWFGKYAGSMMSDFRMDASEIVAKRHIDSEFTSSSLTESAAVCGNNRAAVQMFLKYSTGRGAEKNPSKAFEMAQISYNVFGAGQMSMAKCYLEGINVDKDPVKALEIYKRLADAGNPAAMFQVSQIYKSGIGGDNSEKLYRTYLRMAAEYGNRDAKDIVSKWDARNAKRKNKPSTVRQ